MAADEGEYTRLLPVASRYEEASWVCLLRDDKNAAGGSFYSPGKVARGSRLDQSETAIAFGETAVRALPPQ